MKMIELTNATRDFMDDRQIGHLETMSVSEYKWHLNAENFLFVDSHEHLVDGFTGRCFAASREQLDELIEFLKARRDELNKHDERYE